MTGHHLAVFRTTASSTVSSLESAALLLLGRLALCQMGWVLTGRCVVDSLVGMPLPEFGSQA